MGDWKYETLLRWFSLAVVVALLLPRAYNILFPRVKTSKIRGPPRGSFLLGLIHTQWGLPGATRVVEKWFETYGAVFRRAMPLGSSEILVIDPKATAHILSNSETTYHVHWVARGSIESEVGLGLLSADGDAHKRQRKNVNPGFTSVKVREYSKIFTDCAHKLVAHFDTLTEGSGEFTSDTQKWLNAYALDTIGIAGFGHNFHSLDGQSSDMAQVFELLGNSQMTLADGFVLVLQPIIPLATYYPTPRQSAILKMRAAFKQLAQQFLLRDRTEEKDNRSVLGLLMSAQEATNGSELLESEATSQIGTLILAGYETTSLTLQWVLIELARNPKIQAKLRAELLDKLHGSEDPTSDQISSDLPFLDAVITEILRLHPAIGITLRTAVRDDVVPLSVSITLADGSVTDKLVIAKGEAVTLHNELVNQATMLWGDDAKMFRPERWLEPLPKAVQEISGYRHTLTFLDGPKSCLGRGFAVANMKVFLAHILRRFSFELPGGPETEFEEFVVVTIRVKTKGQTESKVPMRIRRVE